MKDKTIQIPEGILIKKVRVVHHSKNDDVVIRKVIQLPDNLADVLLIHNLLLKLSNEYDFIACSREVCNFYNYVDNIDVKYDVHPDALKLLIDSRNGDEHKIIELGKRFNIDMGKIEKPDIRYEIDDNDLWQLSTLGICCVSNGKRHTDEVLSKIVDFISSSRFEVEILNYEIEILPV